MTATALIPLHPATATRQRVGLDPGATRVLVLTAARHLRAARKYHRLRDAEGTRRELQAAIEAASDAGAVSFYERRGGVPVPVGVWAQCLDAVRELDRWDRDRRKRHQSKATAGHRAA